MDYAEVRDAFFGTREDAVDPEQGAPPGRRLRHALEPLAMVHYWSEPAYRAYEASGLEFLGGYVLSRACVLGEADGAVVASAFGVFEPGMIGGIYAEARAVCSHERILAARRDGAREALRTALGESPDGVADVVAALRRGVEAADPTGKPLFAGSVALGWPDDPILALWHAANTLREYRGDAHLAACVAAGLSGLQANLVTEMQVGWEPRSYTATRGWSPEAMDAATAKLADRGFVENDALTDAGRRLRADVETATEALVGPVLDAIGPDLDMVIERAGGWAEQIVEHGWFPPDPYKRASG